MSVETKSHRRKAALPAFATALAFLSILLFPPPAHAIIDLDADGLDDVWEEKFGAQAVLPLGDDDHDGHNNMKECLGGTDPFDNADCHDIDTVIRNPGGEVTVTFDTVDGKCYQVEIGNSLTPGSFQVHGNQIHGTGSPMTMTLSPSADTDTTGSVTREVWMGIASGSLSSLTADPDYPNNPDGVEALGSLQAPTNADDNYGARIRGFIVPPQTGDYTFNISSRVNSQFWLSTDDSPANLALAASVTSGLLLPEEWSRFGSQQSLPVSMGAGQKYYFEVLHKAAGQEEHCAVGWSGPGLPAGINVIDGDYLCPAYGGGVTNPDTAGQVIYYALNEGSGILANDGVGGDHDGTLAGTPAWTAGVSGGGVQFDGVDDRIEFAGSNDINLAAHDLRTIALWFRADNPTLASKQVIFEEGGGARGLNIYLDSGQLWFGGYNNNENGWNQTFFSTPLTDAGWHHVVLILDAPGATTLVAGALKGYLDGALVGSGGGSTINPHGADGAIGARRDDSRFHDVPSAPGDGDHFAGVIDEVHHLNRVLSQAEIDGLIGNGAAPGPAPLGASTGYVRVRVKDLDQDGDGLTDYSEKLMGGSEGNFSPFDPDSTTAPGGDDFDVVTNALNASSETVTIALADANAVEDNRNGNQVNAGTPIANVYRNVGRFRVNRTGTLQPLTVDIDFADDPADVLEGVTAEPADYQAEDVLGNAVSTSITIPFGHVGQQIVIDPVPDTDNTQGQQPVGNEYPEKVRCNIVGNPAYAVGGSATAAVTITDALDIEEQKILFVGRSSGEPGSTLPQGTAIISGFLNGRKDFMNLNTLIMAGFSSPQNDSHIHKSIPGPLPGNIVYEVTNTPGAPASGPLIGEILDYPWTIIAGGGLRKEQIIDSLFEQDPDGPGGLPAETPLYLNWHTNNNQGGELWAILGPEVGSIDPPDPPAAPPAITPLAGNALEREVRRFLNQATFGATDAEVAALVNEVTTTHGGDRIAAYNAWIDNQIDVIPQTYLVDYTLAADNQEWKLRGFFDPTRWVPAPPQPVPPLPGTAGATSQGWPAIDRTTYTGQGLQGAAVNTMVPFGPNQWIPDENYVMTQNQINWGRNENVYTHYDLLEPNHSNRRRGHWLLMLNANDQLRQKMGYALQQILVVSESLTRVRTHHVGAANYQDMLNTYAFEHFRDQFSWANWSPIMGKWLSSLKNQQAFDTNGDTIPDVFPDENLAREDMQLFSIGLFVLWRDGTLKLDENTGLPTPTYDNDDITEFARVLTGQSFSRFANDPGDWGIDSIDAGNPFDTNNNNAGGNDNDGLYWNTNFNASEGNKYYSNQFNYPMRMFGAFHDPDPKTLAGGKVIDNTSTGNLDARGRDDIEDAVTWFAGQPGSDSFDQSTAHQSTPAFIALRLIQRLTKSNPSSAYLYRVADAFAQDGGNLRDTIKAILLDYEVRELALVDGVDLNSDEDYIDPGETAPDFTAGLKKPPLEIYVQMLRNFSQRPTGPGTFTEGFFSQMPIADPALAGVDAIPEDFLNGTPAATPADAFLNNFGYPAAQAANFTMNSVFPWAETHTNTTSQLNMTPFRQDSVFNYYLPLYSPGGPIAAAGLLSPEMQLATETGVIQNVNYIWTISVNVNAASPGQGTNPIGGDPGQAGPTAQNPGGNPPGSYNQRLLFGADPDFGAANSAWSAHSSDSYDSARLSIYDWAENIISWAPVGTSVNSAAAKDDIIELIDAIDLRLMDGRFKAKYIYDDTNNENGAIDGINPSKHTYNDGNLTNDNEFRNPREIIIDELFDMSYNPYQTNATNTRNAKRDLFRFGLYLMAATPEYLIHK